MNTDIEIKLDNDSNYYIETKSQKIYFPSYQEAEEYIYDHPEINTSNNRIDIFDSFKLYCRKLPGKIYLDGGAIATYNENALIRFIKSFEKTHDCKIDYEKVLIDGEFYCVISPDNIFY